MEVKPIEVLEFAKKLEEDLQSREVFDEERKDRKVESYGDALKMIRPWRGVLVPHRYHSLDKYDVIQYHDFDVIKKIDTGLIEAIRNTISKRIEPASFNDRMHFTLINYDYSKIEKEFQNNNNLNVRLDDKYLERWYEFVYAFKNVEKYKKSGLREININDVAYCGVRLNDYDRTRDQVLVTPITLDINGALEIAKEVNGFNKFHLVFMPKSGADMGRQAMELGRVGNNILKEHAPIEKDPEISVSK